MLLAWMFGRLPVYLLNFSYDDHFFRYFSSAPPPTDPAKIPRPAPKLRPSDSNPQDGPTVLSPPRKSRRVMPGRERFEGNTIQEKIDERVGEVKQAFGDIAEKIEQVPMSIDFSIFGSKPLSRPTINSADRSHLKRKLDLEFQHNE